MDSSKRRGECARILDELRASAEGLRRECGAESNPEKRCALHREVVKVLIAQSSVVRLLQAESRLRSQVLVAALGMFGGGALVLVVQQLL